MDAGRARVTACALALCVCAAWLAPPALAESSVTPDDADARLDRLLRVANHNPANVMNRAHVKFPTLVRGDLERPRNPFLAPTREKRPRGAVLVAVRVESRRRASLASSHASR